MSETPDATLILLGEIKGIVNGLRDGQAAHQAALGALSARIDAIDGRLRVVEQKAALTGAVSGGIMGIGVALIAEGLKHWVGIPGRPGP